MILGKQSYFWPLPIENQIPKNNRGHLSLIILHSESPVSQVLKKAPTDVVVWAGEAKQGATHSLAHSPPCFAAGGIRLAGLAA